MIRDREVDSGSLWLRIEMGCVVASQRAKRDIAA
jgi:hypothetical protein